MPDASRRRLNRVLPRALDDTRDCHTGVLRSRPSRVLPLMGLPLMRLWPCVLLLACGCRVNRPPNDHAATQTLYSSMGSDPGTFNPILVTDSASADAIGDLFEGLVKQNPKTNLIEPDLASTWTLGPDGRTITFHLRHDVRWSDGVPFTAADVLFTLRVIFDPNVPNSISFALTIDGSPITAEAPDPYTVVMHLKRPFAPLMSSIQFPIIPAHTLSHAYSSGQFNRTWGIDTPPAQLVSLGAYRIVRYVPGQQIAFRRYADYWMHDPNGGRLPRLHGQVLLINTDANSRYLQFVAGLTDVYSPRPEEVFTLEQQAARLGITIAPVGIDTGSLFFAFNRNPRHYIHNGVIDPRYKWFTDINFVRALAHAVDKQGMINLCFRGLAIPAVSDVSPENKLYYNPNLKDYDYNLALAAHLLDEAGYKLRDGVRYDPAGHRVEFELTTTAGDEALRGEMCVIFKQDLEKLGIKVDYRPQEFISLVKRLEKSFDWDCMLMGFTGSLEPNDGANFLRSSGNLHLWNPSEPTPATPWEAEIDRLLDEGAAVMDPQARAPYYWRIQEILHDQLPIIETVRARRFIAYKNSLQNYVPTVWGLYRPEMIEFRAD
ncbi:MAG TPA: ABC transporter substrate-binding protein [Candidatus Binataceae bacterium]|nr:ABC transporter substrate-binding protein [Candidatus Binataceae bacterium]